MKLFYSKGACSLAVHIIIHQLGINSDYEAVDLKTKKTASGGDYLQINPKGVVPTIIKDNGDILTENLAIQIYLVETNNNTQLLPPIGDDCRYKVLEWSNYISTELHKGCGPLFNRDLPEEMKETIFRPLLKKKLQFVDSRLGNHGFLNGEEFTISDAYLFVILSWMPNLGIDFSDCKKLSAYFERLKQHPSVVSALEEERASAKH